ncbi:hypothetical protein MRX96_008206 [Rhipicephalus microplus]
MRINRLPLPHMSSFPRHLYAFLRVRCLAENISILRVHAPHALVSAVCSTVALLNSLLELAVLQYHDHFYISSRIRRCVACACTRRLVSDLALHYRRALYFACGI